MNAISANDLGLPAITSAWRSAWDNWIEAAAKPEAGNFDTPECMYWEGVRHRLEDHIKALPITSTHDAKALIQLIWVDSGAEGSDSDHTPHVSRWCLEKLMEWASTPARVA